MTKSNRKSGNMKLISKWLIICLVVMVTFVNLDSRIYADPTPDPATPVINTQPTADQSVNVNTSVTLSVAASVDGDQLSYQWYRNDTAPSTNGSVALGTNPSLTFLAMTGDHYYYVIVTNTDPTVPGGSTTSVTSIFAKVTGNVVTVTNAETPVINLQPTADQTVNVGTSVTLSVAASVYGNGALSYQWYRNSVNTLGGIALNAFNSTFTFAAMEGDYYYFVVVTNTDNTVSGNHTTSVTSIGAKVTGTPVIVTNATAPVIDTQPVADQTVNEGTSVTLSVAASVYGNGTLSYQWHRNSVNSNLGGVALNNATNPSVTLTAGTGDAYYYVIVTNTDPTATGSQTASATSSIAKVTGNALTNATAPVIDIQPVSDQTVNEGTSVTLSVAASVYGSGTLSYQWYRNTTNSTIGSTAPLGANSDSFPVKSSAAELYYYVVVTNTDPSVSGSQTASTTSSIAKVTWNELADAPMPNIDTQPVAQTVNEGDPFTLTVAASVYGPGTLTYQWHRNTINDTNMAVEVRTATEPTFTFPTGGPGEAYYFVKVTNTDNTVPGDKTATATSSVVKVTVNANAAKPFITTQPQFMRVNEGGDATLSVTADVYGMTALSYQWYQNPTNSTTGGTILDGATNASYTPSTASPGISYYYVVVANTDPAVAGYKTSTTTSFAAKVTVDALTYSIAALANQTATDLVEGYNAGSQQTKTIQITNTGTGNLNNLATSLSGTNANAFDITQPASPLNSGSPAASFTVKAKDGLAAGTYTATVTVSADNLTSVTFSVTQVVVPPDVPEEPIQPEEEPIKPEITKTDVVVLVNGKEEYAGTATTVQVDGQTVTTITMDAQKLQDRLASEGQGSVITIPVNTSSDRVIGELNGQMVQMMEQKQAIVELKTKDATYTLPAQQINIGSISEQLGKEIALQDIKIQIEIAATPAAMVKIVENAAANGEFTLVVPPLNFTVTATYGDKTVEVSTFNAYVERTIALPDGIDPNKITTGIVVDPDGTVRHVPTRIVVIEGKYYAVISSLTNSTYSIVWHPLAFKDVENHWAQAAVNDMGSRLVIEGTDNGLFSPDRDITRAEFVAIMVRGLGLKLENGTTLFKDSAASAWYNSAINTAYAYKLISGFEDGTFRPNEKITREQAMVIIAKAMKITGLDLEMAAKAAEEALRPFKDASQVSFWAADSLADNVRAGIVSGRTSTELAPKAVITRAEVAVIMKRLLQLSQLI